jgi:hypothetical protein
VMLLSLGLLARRCWRCLRPCSRRAAVLADRLALSQAVPVRPSAARLCLDAGQLFLRAPICDPSNSSAHGLRSANKGESRSSSRQASQLTPSIRRFGGFPVWPSLKCSEGLCALILRALKFRRNRPSKWPGLERPWGWPMVRLF